MAADTAALVVALSAQLTKFEKDMKQAVTIANTHTKEIESSFAKMNAQIENQLSGFARNAAAGLGPLGAVLGALGPIGLGVAAVVGTMAAAFLFASEKAEQFADKARNLKEFAETAGLSTAELKALNVAAQQVGLDSEQSEKAITKLTVAVTDLRAKGSGPLYDVLVKLRPELAQQVAGAKDTAAAIDILAAAYKNLNTQQQLEFNRAIFGARNLTGGRILGAIGEGGVKSAAAEAIKEGFDPALIERVAKLRQEIEKINKQTDNIWGRAFAVDVLEHQKLVAENWKAIALFVEKVYTFIKTGKLPDVPVPTEEVIEDIKKQIEVQKEIIAKQDQYVKSAAEKAKSIQTLVDLENKLTETLKKQNVEQQQNADTLREMERERVRSLNPPGGNAPAPENLQITLQNQRAIMQVLGDAARITEQYKIKMLELKAAGEANLLTLPFLKRAEEDYALKMNESALAIRQRLGVANEAEIALIRLARLEADAGKLKGTAFELTPEDRAKATTISLRETKEASDALLVRQAYLPGLKQLELDAANVRKGLDQLSTQTFNTLTDGFADVIVGTKSLADAFKSMTESILRDLVRLALRQAVFGPLAGALSGAMGAGFLGSGFATQNQLSGIGNAGWSTEGFNSALLKNLGRQGGGSVSSGHPYFVGEHGMELFVPSQSGQIVPGQLQRGGGGSIVEINNFMAADSETRQSKQQGPDGERVVIDIIKKAQARGELDDVNRGRFAMRPAKVR
jgi:hypothetical protein